MKSKVLKCVALACTLVFMNCDDSAPVSAPVLGDNPAVSSDSQGQLPQDGAIQSSDSQAGQLVGSSDDSATSTGTGDNTVTGTTSSSSVSGDAQGDTPATSSDSQTGASDGASTVGSSSSANDVASGDGAVASSSSVKEEAPTESSSSVVSVSPAPAGIFLAEGTDENKDQMEVEYIEHTGHDGGGILSYPKNLSSNKKHGVVVWGPGGGTEPGAYGGMIRRLASHGFVVIALRESPGNASQAIPALDWLEKKNNDPNDPLYQKLDMSKCGASGHSMGGLESEQVLIKDNRVIAAMLNNSGDLGHSAMAQVSTDKHIGIVYGEGGMERPNAEADYNNPGVKAPACLIRMTGGQGNECADNGMGGVDCGWGHGSGSWGGMAATIAWMRWHLGGEDFRKDDFVGTSGKYINGPIIGEMGNWKGQCKNF